MHINPITSFNWLVILIKGKEERVDLFKYELTSTPTSLFKADTLRKANMAELRNRILQFDMRIDRSISNIYIIDESAPLNQSNWNPQSNFAQVLDQYLMLNKNHINILNISIANLIAK